MNQIILIIRYITKQLNNNNNQHTYLLDLNNNPNNINKT